MWEESLDSIEVWQSIRVKKNARDTSFTRGGAVGRLKIIAKKSSEREKG